MSHQSGNAILHPNSLAMFTRFNPALSLSGTTITLTAVAGQVDNISGDNDFVVVTDQTNGKVGYSSDNGSTWSTGSDTTQIEFAYGDDLYFGKEYFVAVGEDGNLEVSENGGNIWTKRPISSQDLNGVTTGSGSYIQNTTSNIQFVNFRKILRLAPAVKSWRLHVNILYKSIH